MAYRFPHILKGNRSNERPSNCLWFDTETKHTIGPDKKQYHYLWFGWSVFQRRIQGNDWSAPDYRRFVDITDFWDYVESLTRDKTRLYLFAHNGAFDLPVMHAFTELPERGFDLTSAVADAPPLILTWKRGNRTIRFVDTLNIWRLPLTAIGESIGIPKMDMPSPQASSSEWDSYARRDVEVIRVAVLRWLRFLTENDLGGFAPTLASQSFTAYRHRFMPVKIFIDAHQGAIDLARQAYVGGRTECFKIGRYQSVLYYVDVNSMYPAVMREEEYPYRLIGVYADPSHEELERWAGKYTVIAQVLLETEEPAYPIVYEGKLIFPVGRFWATLCAAELDRAISQGHVATCVRAAVYYRAPLFADYIDFMYQTRLAAREAGDETSAWLYKIMMNSLYGKFGQRGRRFETVGVTDPNEIEVWTDIDADTREVTHWRSFGGIVQQWQDEGEATESHPAIAACVTANARDKLYNAIQTAGRENCYYCDTDSLVVNAEGYERLADLLDDKQLGAWALEKELHDIELNGPKDYRFDDVTKIKGIRANAERVSDAVYNQDYFVGFKGLLRAGSLDAPIVYTIQKKLSRNYTKGDVSPDGLVTPYRLNLEG